MKTQSQKGIAPQTSDCEQCYDLGEEEFLLNQGNNPAYQGYWSLYVLMCESNKWYVGISRYLHNRLRCHFLNMGSAWTRKHKPIAIHKVLRLPSTLDREGVENVENMYTLRMMEQHGIGNVRGGEYCKRYPFNSKERAEILSLI